MATQAADLWKLVWGQPYIEPNELAAAVEEQTSDALDIRTRILIRDSVNALREYWGQPKAMEWLAACPVRDQIDSICKEDLGPPGFPTIKVRLMERTDPEVVRELFRNVGTRLHEPMKVLVGGSIALIMPGLLNRVTDDIDFVNEVPEEIRRQHAFVDELAKLYGLRLGHFQSHYLPSGWDTRLHYLDTFGQMSVYLVDPYDVFLSKLPSRRAKDMADLRVLKVQLDKAVLVERLRTTMQQFLAVEAERPLAKQNWYILFGESLPT